MSVSHRQGHCQYRLAGALSPSFSSEFLNISRRTISMRSPGQLSVAIWTSFEAKRSQSGASLFQSKAKKDCAWIFSAELICLPSGIPPIVVQFVYTERSRSSPPQGGDRTVQPSCASSAWINKSLFNLRGPILGIKFTSGKNVQACKRAENMGAEWDALFLHIHHNRMQIGGKMCR
jgi:hypothetical protein